MKKRLLLVALTAAAILVVMAVLWYNFGSIPWHIDTSFATSVRLRYHYSGESIDAMVTDAADIRALKDMLNGWAFGEPNGGVENFCVKESLSITLAGGRRSIVFAPDLQGSPLLQIGTNNSYRRLSNRQARVLHRICRKYCVVWSEIPLRGAK